MFYVFSKTIRTQWIGKGALDLSKIKSTKVAFVGHLSTNGYRMRIVNEFQKINLLVSFGSHGHDY
jgi:hypothetical protein